VEYSVYTMRQASRRSWRIGQHLPVQVVCFAYRGTLQAQALSLVAKKLQSSLAVEGDLLDEGLASHGSGDEDFLLTLARSLTERGDESEESLESLFAEVRRTAEAAETALRAGDVVPEEIAVAPERIESVAPLPAINGKLPTPSSGDGETLPEVAGNGVHAPGVSTAPERENAEGLRHGEQLRLF
jgi:hypothetical protein